MYLKEFIFPTEDAEFAFFVGEKRTCYDSHYPFQVLTKIQLKRMDFEPVTIIYGGNGSGKTTALNVIAETLALQRESPYNRTNFFREYTDLCDYKLFQKIPKNSRIITSDDVFDYMLDLRMLNDKIDVKREDLFDEYLEAKYSDFKLKSIEDIEQLKKVNMSRSKTQSKYVRRHLIDNVREKSNGESAFAYFVEKVQENALYLLDEPENSLSAERQLELVKFIEESARFFGCQFIIATHSPFLLSIKNAKIYDLDEIPVDVKRWTRLKNVRLFYDFFKAHEDDFL